MRGKRCYLSKVLSVCSVFLGRSEVNLPVYQGSGGTRFSLVAAIEDALYLDPWRDVQVTLGRATAQEPQFESYPS